MSTYKQKDGIQKWYYDDGTLKHAINYFNGKRHGVCRNYAPDGTIIHEINFFNGYAHGLRKRWNKTTGEPFADFYYIHGGKVTKKQWNEYSEAQERSGTYIEDDYKEYIMCPFCKEFVEEEEYFTRKEGYQNIKCTECGIIFSVHSKAIFSFSTDHNLIKKEE
jgi:antitoxin component YwqK of YwqJK toxin-antitoxin module